MTEAVRALYRLRSSPRYPSGWVPTGAVADALGCSVRDAAAKLRGAERSGLCLVRRSALYTTTWKLTADGLDPIPLS